MDGMQISESFKAAKRDHNPGGDAIRATLSRRSFATLASTSPAGRPHSAGVLYELVGDSMYVNTLRDSRKARNIASNPHVGLCVPVRRLPLGPPSSVHFQARAELLELDHPAIAGLVAEGKLRSLTNHGELDLPDGCFVRISLPARVNTYGLGMSIRKLIADPLNAGGTAVFRATP